jgi:hypothetical protein
VTPFVSVAGYVGCFIDCCTVGRISVPCDAVCNLAKHVEVCGVCRDRLLLLVRILRGATVQNESYIDKYAYYCQSDDGLGISSRLSV